MTKSISFECLNGLTKREGGLSKSEADAQRSRYGANDIVEVSGNPWLQLVAETFKDPMLWLLIGIGAIFLAIGEKTDGITLFVAVLPLFLMDAFLHWRTQASTSALKSQLSSRVTVMRDSKELEVDTRELVPGDLIAAKSGLMLPADGVFQATSDLQIDESVLTGESLPIAKKQTTLDPFALADKGDVKIPSETLGFAGTRVLTGGGRLRILATGSSTAYGEIVQSVSQMPHERTPLQKSITRLVQILIYSALALCSLLAGVRIFQGHGWLDALLSASTLAVAAIPEEFPVVFTFFLGVGIFRLTRRKVLVRRSVSVENIGRITQICTDKTGTITDGHLTLTHVDAEEGLGERGMLIAALVASNSETDPMDSAIQEVCRSKGVNAPTRMRTFPFTEDRKRETSIALDSTGKAFAYMKGAPETLLGLSSLNREGKLYWRNKVSTWAKDGHKVIAVAQKGLSSEAADQEPESGLQFCGLLAFEDPARPEVPEAMSYCRDNNVRVLMITGDHPDTAAAIAKDAGLTTSEPRVISAEAEPEKFEEKALLEAPHFLKSLDVVARCTPMQKLRIVTALQRAGELVAVTGDGVNDVPALKAADIGIAMGERGSRSAKEVSSIILADDNFSTIVNAIREGRQLFENLRLSFKYLLFIHIPLVLMAAVIPLLGYPLLFLPVHIVWLELIIHPSALFAFQSPADHSVKKRKPYTTFFNRSEFISISVLGLLAAAAIGLSFILGLDESSDVGHGRAKAMVTITFWSAGVLAFLTKLKNKASIVIFGMTILSTVALLQVPVLARLLHLSPLHQADWIVSVGMVSACLILGVAFHRRSTSIYERT